MFLPITYITHRQIQKKAYRFFQGTDRQQQSGVIRLDVSGRPQVLTYETQSVQPFATEEDATLKVVYCADPRPRNVYWEWGSVRLGEGMQITRFWSSCGEII